MPHPPLETAEASKFSVADKYGCHIYAFLLTLFSCRISFFDRDVSTGLDGSWVRGLNMAVHNGLVFGRDFVFTYGPLGFLSTRNPEYLGTGWLLAGDILLFIGWYYLTWKFLLQNKGWFLILLAAIISSRTASYSQIMFLLFSVFASMIIARKESDKVVLVLTGLFGVLLFFIKINYGLVSLFTVVLLIGILLFREKRDAALLFCAALVSFAFIYFAVHIDLSQYIKHSISMLLHFDEAMFLPIDFGGLPFLSAWALFGVIGVFMAAYIAGYIRKREPIVRSVGLICIIVTTCFFFYKNGFTRYDTHHEHFFASMPIYFICVLYLMGYGGLLVSRVVSVGVLIASVWVLTPGRAMLPELKVIEVADRVLPVNYYMQIFEKPVEKHYPVIGFLTERIKKIGTSSVDILPFEISYVQLNGFNYSPRPVPQSCLTFTPPLDGLNADFFAKKGRSEFVLIRNEGIDDHYYAWDESVTKASLHLNYHITDTFCGCTIEKRKDFFLLEANTNTYKKPQFDKIATIDTKIGDTVRVPEGGSYPLYMTANVSYTFPGLIEKVLLQPSPIRITLILSDGNYFDYRFVMPIMEGPVLISNFIGSNFELENFLCGSIATNRNVTAFIIHTANSRICRDVKVSFYRYSNY